MVGVIINPHSKRNRREPRREERMRRVVNSRGHVIRTQCLDELSGALDTFHEDRRRYWVADGGDGALHCMINKAAEKWGVEEAARMAVYVPTKGGTIDFVAKALKLRGSGHQILGRLVGRLEQGDEVPVREVGSLLFRGRQRTAEGREVPFQRLAFGTALAGYGANFFRPYYASDLGRGTPRMIGLMSVILATAAISRGFSGPLATRKPQWLSEAEVEFFRPLRGEVWVDDEPVRRPDGSIVREHTVLHCGSLPVNLGDVLRVFPTAGDGWMHIHAGHVSPWEAATYLPVLMLGRFDDSRLPNAIDRRAKRMEIRPQDGTTLTPALDGELVPELSTLDVTPGPTFRMAVP